MTQVEFVGQSVRDADSVASNSGRLINFYREQVGAGGRAQFVLKSVPALEQVGDIDQVFARAIERVREQVFAVVGGNLYELAESGSVAQLGTVGDSVDTTIAGISTPTQTRFGIAANGDYYLWDGVSLTTPATGAFDDIGSVTSGRQFIVVTEKGGSRFQWSGAGFPDQFDALDFATAEGRDDEIIRAQFINGNLWLFGARSIEAWQVTGLSGANAFQRVPGQTLGVGLESFGLLCSFDSGAMFVGNDGSAYLTTGADVTKISTPPVHVAFEAGTATGCTYYEHEGHKFGVILFSDRPAWVYDMTTREWHERASGVFHEPWGIKFMVRASSGFMAIDDLGTFYSVEKLTTASTELIRRTAVSLTLAFDGTRQRIVELEIKGRSGFQETLDSPVEVRISMSRDNGVTWSEEKRRSMGAIGQYEARQVLRSLGIFRQATMRLDVTDAANLPIDATCRVRIA